MKLTAVEYETLERTPKKSAYWYKKVIETNGEDLSPLYCADYNRKNIISIAKKAEQKVIMKFLLGYTYFLYYCKGF